MWCDESDSRFNLHKLLRVLIGAFGVSGKGLTVFARTRKAVVVLHFSCFVVDL